METADESSVHRARDDWKSSSARRPIYRYNCTEEHFSSKSPGRGMETADESSVGNFY